MTEGTPPSPSLDLIYSEVKERLNIQFQAIESLDSKAGLVLTAGSVVISIAAGLQVSAAETIDTAPLVLLIAGAGAYALCMLFGLLGFKVRDYRRDPEPGPLVDNYLNEDAALTKGQIIANLVESFEKNKGVLESKASYIQRAMLFLALETGILAAALIWRSL